MSVILKNGPKAPQGGHSFTYSTENSGVQCRDDFRFQNGYKEHGGGDVFCKGADQFSVA